MNSYAMYIIAENRRRADEIERDCAQKMKRGERVSDSYAREISALRAEADRLEARWKRKRVTKRHGFCNAAAMREAIVAIRKAMVLDSGHGPTTEFHAVVDTLTQAALAKPPRNCDVYDSYGDAIRAFEDAEDAEDYEEMAEWLLAPATEQKGDKE